MPAVTANETGSLAAIKPADLPVPPQAALEIMRACSKEQANSAELSRLAASDPVVTAELLRVVNSSFYGLGKEIQSIPRAVTVIGQRALRNLALCIAVRDALKNDAIPGFDAAEFWEASLRRAAAGKLLGEALGADPDDCFAAGLLQDFGLLVMFSLHPDKAGVWPQMQTEDPDSRLLLERGYFQLTHTAVGAAVAKQWQLPEELAAAMGHHHNCGDPAIGANAELLCTIARCADWMAAVYGGTDQGPALERCRSLAQQAWGLSAERVNGVLARMPAMVKDAATALGLYIQDQPNFEQVVHEANVRLAEENLSYQELTWKLENALHERDRLAAELNEEMELAREIQHSLLPRDGGDNFPIHAINLPARDLSGDFYDFFTLPDGRIYFNLGDVSGKGMSAALLMAKTSSLFRCLGKQLHDPGKLLEQINTEICETSTRGMFVTMVAGLYDPQTGTLRMVNAGHTPVLLSRGDGTIGALDAQTPPLGIIPGLTFKEVRISLGGGSLYVFSDGVTEGYIAKGQPLGMRGLLKMFAELAGQAPQQRLQGILDRLVNADVALRDDMTLLLVEEPHGSR